MANIDFVPNDYIQKRDSKRANLIYLVLFVLVMGGIGSTFSVIKLRQQAMNNQLKQIDSQISQAQEKFGLLEQLEVKGREMIKTASMTADLYENAPRSVVLAALTNNLPEGTSLSEIKLYEKVILPQQTAQTQYQQNSAAGQAAADNKQYIETNIEIKGIAPSDIEVAKYITRLSGSVMFDGTELVESKELKIDNYKVREFKLTSTIKRDIELDSEDIKSIYERKQLAEGI